MCGITGFFGEFASPEQSAAALERMTMSLKHRGPDGHATWLRQGAGLGHTRLAIIDIDGGAQPMHSADGRYTIAFNGEIYNFAELRKELEGSGYRFVTRCDTEIIPAAVDAWGVEGGLRRLRGMFAFGLYDARENSMLLARDRAGVKPLYWAAAKSAVVFGSEPKALLASDVVPRRVNPVAIHDYLAHGYAQTPHTCFADIEQLPPGSWLQFTCDGRRRSGRFWHWHNSADFRGTEREAVEQLQGLLTDAIKSHLIADVEVGTFLSGGLDSSLIVALMSRNLSRSTQTFSMGFGDTAYDESGPARQVAAACGTDHHEMRIDGGAGDPGLLHTILEQFDEPFGDSSAIPTYLMCREVRKHVKVVLSGDGGDEVLGGYLRYLYARRLGLVSRLNGMLPLLTPAMNFADGHCGRIGNQAAKAFRFARMEAAERLCALQMYFSEDDRERLYNHPFGRAAMAGGTTASRFAALVPSKADDPAQQMIAAEMGMRLHADYLRKVDVASSAHGLEVRVPFLDNRMLDFSGSLPVKYKLSLLGETKILSRRLAQQVLPAGIASRRKQGFSIPLDHWAGSSMRSWLRDLLLGPSSCNGSLFERSAVENVWNAFDGGSSTVSRYQRYQRMFLLVSLEMWLRRWQPSVG